MLMRTNLFQGAFHGSCHSAAPVGAKSNQTNEHDRENLHAPWDVGASLLLGYGVRLVTYRHVGDGWILFFIAHDVQYYFYLTE